MMTIQLRYKENIIKDYW